MKTLRDVYVAGHISDVDVNRLYHALIDVSDRVIGFDDGLKMWANRGLCCLILSTPMFNQQFKRILDVMLNVLFANWDKYSGWSAYPVPHPDMTPAAAYHHTREYNQQHMWDRLHPYGANRRELLTHCINEVSKLRLEIQNGLKPYPINR